MGIIQVYTGSFWMGAFEGPSAKRHRLWSNDRSFLMEIVAHGGYLPKEIMKNLPGKPLVKRYIDKQGKKRHVGIPETLRKSQLLVCTCEKNQWKCTYVIICDVISLYIDINMVYIGMEMETVKSAKQRSKPTRAYTVQFADLIAKLARLPPKAGWLVKTSRNNSELEHIDRSHCLDLVKISQTILSMAMLNCSNIYLRMDWGTSGRTLLGVMCISSELDRSQMIYDIQIF